MMRIIVHGGAGRWGAVNGDDVIKVLMDSVYKGLEVLEAGGFSGEAVVEIIKVMEDSGLFNAGIGSSLNIEGVREMDAGYGDSLGRVAGVAAVKAPRNPIKLAYLVALKTNHKLIVGREADRLAIRFGMEKIGGVPEKILNRYIDMITEKERIPEKNLEIVKQFYGDTVGAIALDEEGRIAVGVSTGGLWLKLPGRVGDSPLFGAGFYVSREYGVCGTGIGEEIIQELLSYRAYLEYRETGDVYRSVMVPLEEMAIKSPESAGLIALDKYGNMAYHHNTRAMAVAYYDGERVRAIISRKPD